MAAIIQKLYLSFEFRRSFSPSAHSMPAAARHPQMVRKLVLSLPKLHPGDPLTSPRLARGAG